MKTLKKYLALLLAALMAFGACGGLAEAATPTAAQLTLDDLEALGAVAYAHNDRVTFVDGPCTDRPVADMDDAEAVVDGMLGLLGGDGRTRLQSWRTLTDAVGNTYYVFQQMHGETTVSGGAVKVVADAGSRMLGLTASLVSGLPETEAAEGIAAEQAEAIVLKRLADADQAGAELVADRTDVIVLPSSLGIDIDEEDEDTSSRFVWVVYTTNPGGSNAHSDLPYLAHYVTMGGEYLYSLPTILPGDEAGATGFNTAYVFEFMEPVDYTGTVQLSTGEEKEITVQVMRDTRTGMYYLGNLQRRIAVADCWEFLYNDGHVVLEASADNTGWDNTCLLSLYNYCKAWDAYESIGWTGGDGMGTPILILKDFCNRDHAPMDNAAYAGKYYGWQTFLASNINDFSQCLDVLGHEFTHCVTGSVMTYNAYMNDYGAINEAMSDIQGNLIEMLDGATEDAEWLIGENGKDGAIRSMSDPHRFQQPDYAWDVYYTPNVKTPTELNDRGGVHTNSSLLNNIAYRLCENGGMSLAEAHTFWFAVDCAMVPGTDYPQLAELLPWVLKNQGMARYAAALEAALDATRLRTEGIPDVFDGDRAMVALTLPDDARFTDGQWMLMILSVDVDAIMQRADDIMNRRGEYAATLGELAEALDIDPALLPTARELSEDPGHAWDRLAGYFTEVGVQMAEAVKNKNGEAPNIPEAKAEALAEKRARVLEILKKCIKGTITLGSASAGQDGRTVRVVSKPGITVPMLYRLEIDSEMNVHSVGLAVYTLGSWFDVGTLLMPILSSEASGESDGGETADEAPDLAWLDELLHGNETDGDKGDGLSGLLGGLFGSGEGGGDTIPGLASLAGMFDLSGGMKFIARLLLFTIRPGAISEIPNAGLDSVAVLNVEDYDVLKEMFSELLTTANAAESAVNIDYGASDRYTREDMDAAIARIRARFDTWEGCELHSLRYAGDECASGENLKWLNGLGDGSYTRCIEFLSDFHSPVAGGGAWMADREYTDWQWWLACGEDGDWKLLSWGY